MFRTCEQWKGKSAHIKVVGHCGVLCCVHLLICICTVLLIGSITFFFRHLSSSKQPSPPHPSQHSPLPLSTHKIQQFLEAQQQHAFEAHSEEHDGGGMHQHYQPPPPVQPQQQPSFTPETDEYGLLPLPPALPPIGCIQHIDIIITTIPRQQHPPYLITTLQSIQAINEDAVLCPKLRVHVFNLRPTLENPVWQQAKQLFTINSNNQEETVQQWVFFHELDTEQYFQDAVNAPIVPELQERLNSQSADRRSRIELVKRRTLDFSATASYLSQHSHQLDLSKHVIWMEDDFEFCDPQQYHLTQHLSTIFLYIQQYSPLFSALRFTHGFSGLMLHTSDLLQLSSFTRRFYRLLPVDDLLGRYWTGDEQEGRGYFGKRRFVTYRYLLARHIGTTSSINGAHGQHSTVDTCLRQLDRSLFGQLQLYWDPSIVNGGSEFFDPQKVCSDNPDFSPCLTVS